MRNRINDLEADVVSQKSMADDKMKEMAEEAKEWKEKVRVVRTTHKNRNRQVQFPQKGGRDLPLTARGRGNEVCSFIHVLQPNFILITKLDFS